MFLKLLGSVIMLGYLIMAPVGVFAAAVDGAVVYGKMNSTQVRQLQTFLKGQKVYTGPVTGNFFNLTRTALRKFQLKNKLSVTGVLDEDTAVKIAELDGRIDGVTFVVTEPVSEVSQTPSTQISVPNVQASTTVTVTFNGGFEIGSGDYGRPVNLIASMLGVEPDVFRKAFSGVTPSVGSEPTGEQARANKTALLSVLAPYGVTNEKMDMVANYYRFNQSMGQTWPHAEAKGVAVVKDGIVTQIIVTDPGYGYTVAPQVVVSGVTKPVNAVATVAFTKDFKTNGSISGVLLK